LQEADGPGASGQAVASAVVLSEQGNAGPVRPVLDTPAAAAGVASAAGRDSLLDHCCSEITGENPDASRLVGVQVALADDDGFWCGH
jgi:hypothetical protein